MLQERYHRVQDNMMTQWPLPRITRNMTKTKAYTSFAYSRFFRITLRQDLTFHDVLLFYFA